MAESNVAQVIASHQERVTFHTLRSLIEQRILITHNNSIKHWKGDHGTVTIKKEQLEDIIHAYTNAGGKYIDAHAWYFTPDSFKNIITTLYDLSYIQLKIAEIYPTLYGRNEFWAILKKTTGVTSEV